MQYYKIGNVSWCVAHSVMTAWGESMHKRIPLCAVYLPTAADALGVPMTRTSLIFKKVHLSSPFAGFCFYRSVVPIEAMVTGALLSACKGQFVDDFFISESCHPSCMRPKRDYPVPPSLPIDRRLRPRARVSPPSATVSRPCSPHDSNTRALKVRSFHNASAFNMRSTHSNSGRPVAMHHSSDALDMTSAQCRAHDLLGETRRTRE